MIYCGLCGKSSDEGKIFSNRSEDLCFDCRKDRQLQRDYKITLAEYNEMFERQDGVCAICENPPGKRMLAVDHCHKTGKIRGLLCYKCNTGLGCFNDRVITFMNAIEYLENSK